MGSSHQNSKTCPNNELDTQRGQIGDIQRFCRLPQACDFRYSSLRPPDRFTPTNGRKKPLRRNRRSLSLVLRERCRRALKKGLPGLLADARDAFSNFAPMQPSSLPDSSRCSQYTRARACDEEGEYRRAISALSSELLADRADPAA